MNASSSLTLQSQVRVSDDVLFQDLEGEAVLLNLKSGVYFGLDPVGTRIWRLIEDKVGLGDIVETIVAEYDVDAARSGADLLALVEDLAKNELVRAG